MDTQIGGNATQPEENTTKFCKYCGEKIDMACIICPKCGKQVEQLKQEPPQVVIHNNNVNANTNINKTGACGDYPYKNRIVALLLAVFLGYIGIHRFYVGKIGTGIIWLFTLVFFGIGWIVDVIIILIGGFRDKAGMPLK